MHRRYNISDRVASQLPRFVRADHPTFVAFLEAYYEWLEDTNDYRAGQDLLSERDVDETMDSFLDEFKNEYLLGFPKNLASNPDGTVLNQQNLIKNIKDFYRAKGTEKSYNFLMRILFDSTSELYYPKTDILKVSAGVWTEKKSIKTTNKAGDEIYNLRGRQVQQKDPNGILRAYARVVDVETSAEDGIVISELYLSDIFGEFGYDTPIQGTTEEGITLTENVFPVVARLTVSSPGTAYQVGDRITLKPKDPTTKPNGFGFLARVDSINVGNVTGSYENTEGVAFGEIATIRIINFGFNYDDLTQWQLLIDSNFGSGADISVTNGGQVNYPGYYSGTDGQISSNKKIQDSNYYQEFSYELKTEIAYDRWIDIIKSTIHPAGMKVFGNTLLYRRRKDTDLYKNHVEMEVFENPIIGHYTPYQFNSHENLRDNSQGIDVYPNGYNPYACWTADYSSVPHDPYSLPTGSSQATGPLSAGVRDIIGYNSMCPALDVNNTITGSSDQDCEFNPIAVDSSVAGSNTYGCCTDAEYWIIYPHPNSRGIADIPKNIDATTIWFYDYGVTGTGYSSYENGLLTGTESYFTVHEKVYLKSKRVKGTALAGEDVATQRTIDVGEIIDWEYNPQPPLTGNSWSGFELPKSEGYWLKLVVANQGSPFFSNVPSGVDLDHTEAESTSLYHNYYLHTQDKDIKIALGGLNSSDDPIDGVVYTGAIVVHAEQVPNPFIHIMLNHFFRMPYLPDYKYKTSTAYDLGYKD